ncbi:RNA polymerase subunit sigma-70 [Rhodobacterales bacterium HKCCE3408]|nr:RNA polymerase subunit sigma-70 [Rhodobacterales bacterium HKCCE3408]
MASRRRTRAREEIDRTLRRLYDDVVAEPVPEHLQRLIDDLRKAGARPADPAPDEDTGD